MFTFCLLLGIAAVLHTPCLSQELQVIAAAWERHSQLEVLDQYPDVEDVLDAMTSLQDLWTVHLQGLVENASNSSVSASCYNSAMSIILGSILLRPNITIPAMAPLLDATGKQGAGLLDGNFILNAAFDECFDFDYTGYCLGKVRLSFIAPTSPFSWTVGLCVPKHCSASDVAAVMNFAQVFEVDENAMACTDTKIPAYSPGAIIMIAVCAAFVMLVVVGTILDKVYSVGLCVSMVPQC